MISYLLLDSCLVNIFALALRATAPSAKRHWGLSLREGALVSWGCGRAGVGAESKGYRGSGSR